MDTGAKSQLVDRLKTANSVLVTVSRNPTVDQLAACIGLTLIVNKLGKHGSAVFSGQVPSTIEFLKPEDTLEKTADSLRDFIIALDKSKADKLRYKVEDQMVKIFITPYRTSLSEKDLEFSQGDFNVELVVALGVKNQEDLDQAITSHGRILHDATVACINTTEKADLGTINWQEPAASSLCELVTSLAGLVGENLLDQQIATALLTGIIAETDRFSNEKTSSQTMSVSGLLMGAGANQQLVATNLGEAKPIMPIEVEGSESSGTKTSDGTLSINHDKDDLDVTTLPKPAPELVEPAPIEDLANITDVKGERNYEASNEGGTPTTQRLVTEPPSLGGTLTANSVPEQYDPSTDPLSNTVTPANEPTLSSENRPPALTPTPSPLIPPSAPYTPPPSTWSPPPAPSVVAPPPAPTPAPAPLPLPPQPPIDTAPHPDKTLDEIEEAVDSPHLKTLDANEARQQVDAIISETPSPEPQADLALNALPLGQPLHEDKQPEAETPAPTANTTGLDPSLFSEVPKAPAVPPPIYKNPISGDNLPTDNQQT